MIDDEPSPSKSESLLFWVILALAFFAAFGFIAGVLYPFYT
ncbi:hypothetical protein [Acidovorax sp.]